MCKAWCEEYEMVKNVGLKGAHLGCGIVHKLHCTPPGPLKKENEQLSP